VRHVAALLEFAKSTRIQGSLGAKVPEATIFLVEDETLIRMMLVEMVEELGHRVVAEAGNIRDGVALAGMAVFDFAILDINIGGYSISPVAEIIAERGLPFFFVSGYGAGGRPEEYSDRLVLQKPVLMAKLGEAINSILSTGNVSARGA
jgi:CheY-like chemotaxis protein